MIRPGRTAAAVVAVVVAAALSVPLVSAVPASASVAAPPLLPGEVLLTSSHGGRTVSSYLYGINDGINYLGGKSSFDGNTAVQADIKRGGLTLDRMWAYATDSDASITARVTAMHAAGMRCMVMLGSPGNLSWLEHVVTMLRPTCRMFEWGNEPDNGGGNVPVAQATADWNNYVPRLQAIAPGAVFGGPAVAGAGGRDPSAGHYPSDAAYFLAKADPAPAFVSFHDYGCGPSVAPTEASCVANAGGDLEYNTNLIYGWERQYLGHLVPTGVSEYNFDPGSQNLYSWGTETATNERFQFEYTQAFLTEAATLGLSFATAFTSMNDSAYGLLDIFSNSGPAFAPKPYYYAIVNKLERHGNGSTVAIPSYPG